MKKSKLTTLITSMTLCGLVTLGAQPAAMARTAPQHTAMAAPGDAFMGTKAELIATGMPTLLGKAGYQVQPGDLRLSRDLQQMFNGRGDFLWDQTLVKPAGAGLDFSVTLPATDSQLNAGVMVLGVLEHGTLARAFVMQTETGGHHLAVRLSNPDGGLVGTYTLAETRGGFLKADRAQLMALAGVLSPETFQTSGAIFDQIINLLNQILDLLYMVRDLVNMAICAVEEVEHYVRNVEGCGWTNIHGGGGYIVNLIVCSVGETIQLFNDLSNYCF